MRACRLEQSILKKNDDIQLFPFSWNGEKGSKYLFYYLLTDCVFV